MTPAYAALRDLMLEVYGRAPAQAELEWWFERNPVRPGIVQAVPGESAAAMSYVRLRLDGEPMLGGLSLHAVSAPAARGKGTFSRLERENEDAVAAAGGAVLIAFVTEAAARVFLGRLGWELLDRPRVWARPRLLPRRGRELPSPSFTDADAAALTRPVPSVVVDSAWLDWRYGDSPRPYGRVDGPGGFAVVGLGRHGRFVTAAVCEIAGGARVLRRAARATDARFVLGLPGSGRRLAYLAAGFLPTPWRLRFVGRRLDGDAPLPRGWRLDLGDTDFF